MTAVEWLGEQISYKMTTGEIISYHKNITSVFEQAKEMEKQQIIDAVDYGKDHAYDYSVDNEVDYYSSEEYYNEKFKN